jgi:hypothetical protein
VTNAYFINCSNFVRGIVCSKNVRHKRMISGHRNAKLLILGGALDYQKTSNKFASIGTIIEEVCVCSVRILLKILVVV